MLEKGAFAVRARSAGETTQLATPSQDPVAGDDNRDGVGPAGAANGAGDGFRFFGQLSISHCFAERNLRHFMPNALLKDGPGRRKREVEVLAAPLKVVIQLTDGFIKELSSGAICTLTGVRRSTRP